LTLKRVPGGVVSNWFCDYIKIGQLLTVRGPAGKFSWLNYPSSKRFLIGAGSGVTPIMSMSRWIVDTIRGGCENARKLLRDTPVPAGAAARRPLNTAWDSRSVNIISFVAEGGAGNRLTDRRRNAMT
jgi:hypothetical protein